MADGKKPAAGKPVRNGKVVAIVVVSVVVSVVGMGIAAGSYDGSTAVPAPSVTERADTVAILRRATEQQNVCYGWRLSDSGRTVVSAGSNLGDGVPVDSDPTRCPRWVEVVADVVYTSESSESEDSASVWVESTVGVSSFAFDDGLKRLGLDDGVFIDDPGWAITRAAVSLPLLMAEQGKAPAASVSTAAPAAAPSPLPNPGSDLWRDRWGYLVTGAVLLLFTALLVTIGLAQRRRQHRPIRVPKQNTTPSGERVTDQRKTTQSG